MNIIKFYKISIYILIVSILLIVIILLCGYKFNKEYLKKYGNIEVLEYRESVKNKYLLFLEQSKTEVPKSSFENLNKEIQDQIEEINGQILNIPIYKQYLLNDVNRELIKSKRTEFENYISELENMYNFLQLKNEVPQKELPGYFVVMQVLINNKYKFNQPIQRNYNNEYVKLAFLTFDDGPSVNTNSILKILNDKHVRATFFLIGTNIAGKENVVDAIIEQGSSIGVHSFTHDTKKVKDGTILLEEMNRTKKILQEDFDYNTSLARVPTGSTLISEDEKKMLMDNEYYIIDWNVDSRDWESDKSEDVYDNVKNGLHSDTEVILFHEKDLTVEVLPEIIDLLRDENYYIVNIPKEGFVNFKFGSI